MFLIHRILPGWKKWTYCNGLKEESSVFVWFIVNSMFFDKLNHELLSYIICSLHDPHHLQELRRGLRDRFRDSTNFEKNTAIIPFSITLFHSYVSRIWDGNEFLKDILMNYNNIIPE